ncbi:hypothetical protein A3B36_01485 [Candidatus Uhrbacteria bacterium RIFCSPLOWO2_01_FULL_55_36]|nr:MAG: hypothetical protein A3B36_01485 [Candidatus Uhrbacteria bacterium RIFCSPLOWO2_01_FULL_55_36]
MLDSSPQGERGKYMTLLTEARGLVVAQGQGVMPARSKLGGSLTPYRLLSITVATRNIERVIGVEVLETFVQLWRDAKRQGYAAWALSAIAQCVKPGAADQKLFHLTLEYLRIVNNTISSEKLFPLLRLAFAVKFIHLLGYHGSGMTTHPFMEIADQVVRTNALRDALSLLARVQKKVHAQVELILEELSGEKHSMPARFLMSLDTKVA